MIFGAWFNEMLMYVIIICYRLSLFFCTVGEYLFLRYKLHK